MPSESKKQHNFMEAVAHGAKGGKAAKVPKAVGKEFVAADKAEGRFAAKAKNAKRK